MPTDDELQSDLENSADRPVRDMAERVLRGLEPTKAQMLELAQVRGQLVRRRHARARDPRAALQR